MQQQTASVSRYHALWVSAHWLTAILIAISIGGGIAVLRHIPNADPEKALMIRGHALGGIAILVLLLLRLALRATTRKPAPANTGNAVLDGLRRIVHVGLYVAAIAMVSTGLGTLAISGAIPAVFSGTGTLPADFWAFPPRQGHWFISRLLLLLVALHVAGVIYHQFIRSDGLLRRMGFGRR